MVAKRSTRNLKKIGPAGYSHHGGELFGAHSASGGLGGNNQFGQKSIADYLTRLWAKGPANSSHSTNIAVKTIHCEPDWQAKWVPRL